MQQPLVVRLLISSLVIVSELSLRSLVDCIIFDEVQSVNVWLTVSSLANKDPNNKSNLLFRQIELNWINAPLNDDGDYIALYLDSEPDVAGGATPVSVHHPNGISGKLLVPDHYLPVIDFYNETLQRGQLRSQDDNHSNHLSLSPAALDAIRGHSQLESSSSNHHRMIFNDNRWNQYRSSYLTPDFGPMAVPPPSHRTESRARRQEDWQSSSSPDNQVEARLVDECIGYCVAYHSQRRILAKSCLRTRPNWMQESQIGSRSLTTIAIAGTHNSGTYLRQKPASHKIDKSVLQLINKYQLNQEESVFNQLVYGIRYLDLRVGFSKVRNRPEELWIYHDIFRTDNSLNEILNQIKRFLELARGEIVIIDFHRFTVGFQNEDPETELERHGRVLDLLFTTLGDYIVPSYLGQNAPLNEYISLNKRLFVGYAGRSRLLSMQSAGATTDEHSALQLGTINHNYQLPVPQQVRDIDADKQDDNNQTVAAGGLPQAYAITNNEDDHQDRPDRRIGTRVYNRLKSLKLISHSFSKRSIELHKETREGTSNNNNKKQTTTIIKSGNVYKAKHSGQQHSDRSMKIVNSQLALPSLTPQSFSSKLTLLFNPVHHVWPNTDKEDTLRQFIEHSACRKYFGELNSLMAELTPTVFGAISDKYDGIRRLSSLTNRMVGDLIRSKFLHCINLIATDYFLGNDLIRLTIYANKMRQHHRNTNDLDSMQSQCKSFRQIRPLLERSKTLESNQVLSSSTTASINSYQSEGISDLITSFFKRIFN